METSKESFYLASLVVTWATGLIGAGIGIGRSRAKSNYLKERLDKLEAKQTKDREEIEADKKALEIKQQKDIDELRDLIKSEFAKFQTYFHDSDGGDRFMTERKHDLICGNQKEHWQEMKENQGEIFKKLSSLAISVGKIEQGLK